MTPGQTLGRFEAWTREEPGRTAAVARFEAFLRANHVDGVLPTHQILRTDERWPRCGPPFILPPRGEWDRIVPTLRAIRDEVRPVVGEVVVVSGFRGPELNRCIGGGSRSAHLRFGALDLRPTRPITQDTLHRRLCAVHARVGPERRMGLGLYRQNRFHVDAAGYRTWGYDYTGKTSPCRKGARKTA